MEATTTDGMHEFFANRGGLHDCEIRNIVWGPGSIEISVGDLNANFLDLPEYSGLQPARLVLDGVRSVELGVSPVDGALLIYEASVRTEDGGSVVEFRFSPGGRLVVQFTTMRVESA